MQTDRQTGMTVVSHMLDDVNRHNVPINRVSSEYSNS